MIEHFKNDFATLMSKLEGVEKDYNETKVTELPMEQSEKIIESKMKSHNINQTDRNYEKGMVAAAVGVILINTALLVGSKLFRK